MQRDLLDMVYPVGRGFIDFTDTDYSTYLGFTWERELMGMFPLGANDTNYEIGSTGGAATKTISKDNLPNYELPVVDTGHKHKVESIDNGSEYYAGRISRATNGSQKGFDWGNTDSVKTGIKVKSGGKGEPLNTMPPYKAVYYWKRVA